MSALERLYAVLDDIDIDSFPNEDDRSRAEDLIMDALVRVRKPWDIALNHNWVNPCTNAATKTLIDVGVFRKWVENGSKPQTSVELASLTDTDPTLIKRIVRQLAAQHLLIETAEDTYAPTAWATTLGTDPSFPALYGTLYHDITAVVFGGMPSFLRKTGYKNPIDDKNGVIQHVKGPDTSFFEYIIADPVRTEEFTHSMECHSKGSMVAWPDVYPTNTLIKGAKPGRALVVDIGGSKGHDLEKFRLRHPDIPEGSLILQDLPGVLRDVHISNKIISKCPYDFFTPQPVKGARAYFLHTVLHDWPDDGAAEILKVVAAAMEKGYSKALIHECMVENIKPSLRTTTSDLTMLACSSSAERTVKEWDALLSRAGLGIVKIWKRPAAMEGVIEAELI
ncbi:S-adenosyl-L-methionine-dependent methyltransferase [Annulohypoxylon maeteangense]|uniref:S-adenosyl-L-methionine-dependent methyltransferase n=1 Tax=Annulohypoxylon maeteangense TaxID=1927788 RepID=UPI002008073A|nr:S-adenosyl-L-methionine-dependent methyltransferase [Annulohypoxylon maeteangense]KAI0885192.1 S-adenosyl-L-methionine-dependent methyltransferase [Annulohypoxylon maeteangense]